MSTEPQRLTIIGTGGIAAVVAARLVNKNRQTKKEVEELKQKMEEAEKNKEIDKIDELKKQIEEKESKIVIISILGKDNDSESYKAFKNGVTVNFKHVDEDGKETPEVIEFDDRDFAVITTDTSEIKKKTGEQDHVFVAIKRYSYSDAVLNNINTLKKTNPNKGQETSVILGHNGLQCWFPVEGKNKDGGELHLDEEMYQSIGEESIHGCAINIAAGFTIDSNNRMNCKVSTPVEKMNMPISRPDSERPETTKNLTKIFEGSDIRIGCSTPGGITKDVLDKLKINVVINALTTLLDCDIKTLFEDPLYEQMALDFNSFAKHYYKVVELRNKEELHDRLKPVGDYKPTAMRDFFAGKEVELTVYEDIIRIKRDHPMPAKEDHLIIIETIKGITEILKNAVDIRNGKIAELEKKYGEGNVPDDEIAKAAKSAINSVQNDIKALRNENSNFVREKSNRNLRLKEKKSDSQTSGNSQESRRSSDEEDPKKNGTPKTVANRRGRFKSFFLGAKLKNGNEKEGQVIKVNEK